MHMPILTCMYVITVMFFCYLLCCIFSVGGFPLQLAEFIIGVFLQLLGLPFVAVAQVSLFSKVTADRTQGETQYYLVSSATHRYL